jgi:hypothetical protein
VNSLPREERVIAACVRVICSDTDVRLSQRFTSHRKFMLMKPHKNICRGTT